MKKRTAKKVDDYPENPLQEVATIIEKCFKHLSEEKKLITTDEVCGLIDDLPVELLISALNKGENLDKALNTFFETLWQKLKLIDVAINSLDELYQTANNALAQKMVLSAVKTSSDDFLVGVVETFEMLHLGLMEKLDELKKTTSKTQTQYLDLKKLESGCYRQLRELGEIKLVILPELTKLETAPMQNKLNFLKKLDEKRILLNVLLDENKDLQNKIGVIQQELQQQIALIQIKRMEIENIKHEIRSFEKVLKIKYADPYMTIDGIDQNVMFEDIPGGDFLTEVYLPPLNEAWQLIDRMDNTMEPVRIVLEPSEYFPDLPEKHLEILKCVVCAMDAMITSRSKRGRTIAVVVKSLNECGYDIEKQCNLRPEKIENIIRIIATSAKFPGVFISQEEKKWDRVFYRLTPLGKKLAHYWWQSEVLPSSLRGENGKLRQYIKAKDLSVYQKIHKKKK